MYEVKKFEHLLGLEGFSDELLKNHFTLYEGYVKNTNGLVEMLDAKEIGTVEYSELQRRFGWEFNGMRLHELYFENLVKGGSELEADSDLGKLMIKLYGSFENWKKNFVSVGTMRGIGWVVLYLDKENGELRNVWINEHDTGHLAGCVPILVLDVFEHAYMLQYGLKRADYLEAFMKNICFHTANTRFSLAQ
ncbi:MAG: Fe-Mn family superoxide dismutase [Candidatus Moraniibacteriota bacterium]